VRAPACLLCCLVLALGLAACGSSDKGKKAPGSAGKPATTATQTQAQAPARTATAPAPAAPPRCVKAKEPAPRAPTTVPKPSATLPAGKAYVAVVDTNCGTFTIALDVKGSPKTAASFANLARRGYFDGTFFHRIVHGFVIQGGDPTGTGQGGPGYSVVEAPPSSTRYTKGVVAMAKTEIEDPGTSGSQFYVVTADDAQLPPDYAVLGKVASGQAVVDLIGLAPTDTANPDPARQERPVDAVVIRSVRIVARKG
jgi:cyclophilin family peptidyl-prolyl cis-trans isomerase